MKDITEKIDLRGNIGYKRNGWNRVMETTIKEESDSSGPSSNKQKQYKIYFAFFYLNLECYREQMVSFFPMLPLTKYAVSSLSDADYIIYMNPYARCEDVSEVAIQDLQYLDQCRKSGAELIVVGKAANAEKNLNGSISNITFWHDHFTEKLGKKFGVVIYDKYFVYDDELDHLAIWPVDGCLQHCGFCRRTYMHIPFESLPLETLKEGLDFIKKVAPEKMKHISLRAENLSEYGIDLYGSPRLHEVINLVDSYKEVETIEFGIGLSVGEMTPKDLEAICKSDKITKMVMSLEAGSDRLLRLIQKPHTVKQAIHVFKEIRQAHPNVIISTAILIGLPTETLNDISMAVYLIAETEPDYVLANYYVCTPNQPLAKLPQLSKGLKEYHLKFFLSLLKIFAKRDVTVEHYKLFKKRYSRKQIRLAEQNQKWLLLPLHFSSTETYKVYF